MRTPTLSNTNKSNYFESMHNRFQDYIAAYQNQVDLNKCIRVDLHCHDLNSDKPDELWGRILNVPETWVTTEQLTQRLQRNGADLLTITNHNNAKSCWDLMEKGHDVLVGAEFTCFVPQYKVYIHVLTFGFTPEQEIVLNKKRRNLYRFLTYTKEQNLVTVMPHPLYFYSAKSKPSVEMMEHFALLFDRYETVNGQRDIVQNTLVFDWLKSLTPEKIDGLAKKHGINPFDFCDNPYVKIPTGGTDDHNGIFAGSCGSYLEIDNSSDKPLSELALDAMRQGKMAPYGIIAHEEKLNIAFLDYFCQLGLNMKDPGLMRVLLHRGSVADKVSCLALANGMMELQRHKFTTKFFKAFHQSLQGKKPSIFTNLYVSKSFKPILNEVNNIAHICKDNANNIYAIDESIYNIFTHLQKIVFGRASKVLGSFKEDHADKGHKLKDILESLDMPSHFRGMLGGNSSKGNSSSFNLGNALDQLSFPTLISAVISASYLASNKALNGNKDLLKEFTKTINVPAKKKRVLWLTDTLFDKNGVSSFLQLMLKEIQKYDYPIDIAVCESNIKPQPNLHVLEPIHTFSIKEIDNQEFRVPNLLDLKKLFNDNNYDAVICSTEFLMGAYSLFLKHSFNVPVYQYMHTDWYQYAKDTMGLNRSALATVRRALRTFYRQFDGMFVLNEQHERWLSGESFEIEKKDIFLTGHWVDHQVPEESIPGINFLDKLDLTKPILLYVGRISREKGICDLAKVYKEAKEKYPDMQLVIAGTGPDEKSLKEMAPDAIFLGWISKSELSSLYKCADLLILPSKFDTFSCTILEAMSSGLPSIAYNCKGPARLIQHGVNGYLANNSRELSEYTRKFFDEKAQRNSMRHACIEESHKYNAKDIMDKLLMDINILPGKPSPKKQSYMREELIPEEYLIHAY